MSSPLVSIIIPLYNAEKYCAQTINNVIAQNYKNWELIIVNDGSTDNSLKVVEQYRNENVRIYSQKKKGASAARNYGLKEAKGLFIQFLDADDLLSADKIAIQVKQLSDNPGKISYSSNIYFFDGEEISGKKSESWACNEYNTPEEFLIGLYGGYKSPGGMIPIHSWLTPVEIIQKAGSWNEYLTVDDDGEYFCRVVLASNGVLYADKALCFYRKYKNGKNLSDWRHENAMKSILKSAEFKGQHLLSKCDNIYAKKAIGILFREIEVITYPHHRELYMQARTSIEKLGGTDYVPAIGGTTIEMVKNLMGWQFARKLQFHLRNFHNALKGHNLIATGIARRENKCP
jgi:glycosyltransferase involved in cell wall biosynthesis